MLCIRRTWLGVTSAQLARGFTEFEGFYADCFQSGTQIFKSAMFTNFITRQEDGCSGVDFMIRTGSTPVSFFSLHLFQSGGYVLQKRQIHRLTHVKLRRLSHHPRYPASAL